MQKFIFYFNSYFTSYRILIFTQKLLLQTNETTNRNKKFKNWVEFVFSKHHICWSMNRIKCKLSIYWVKIVKCNYINTVYIISVIYGLRVLFNRLDVKSIKLSEGIANIVQVDQFVGRWTFILSSASVFHMFSLNCLVIYVIYVIICKFCQIKNSVCIFFLHFKLRKF